jgi:SulP family sulfate permease
MSNLFHALFIVGLLALGGHFIARIPVPALAGVTAYIGLCLLEWSTWRRLPRMRLTDACAFLATAVSVLVVNAVLAVAIGCSFYGIRAIQEIVRNGRARELASEKLLEHATPFAGK